MLICTEQKHNVLKTIGHFGHRSLHNQAICQQFNAFKLSALIWPSVNKDHRPLSTRQSAFIVIANRQSASLSTRPSTSKLELTGLQSHFFHVRCYITVSALSLFLLVYSHVLCVKFSLHMFLYILLSISTGFWISIKKQLNV